MMEPNNTSSGRLNVSRYLDDRPGEGAFRVHRAVYCDPELFDLERKFIFERTWNFLAHDSQIRKPHDFVAAYIGRVPVLVTRDGRGEVRAFLNACRHKGALLTRTESGNCKYLVCPYHGWAYDSSGQNVNVKNRKEGRYAAAFDADGHDLVALPRVASYKGLVFGSLSPDVPPLEEFLGEMRLFIDLAMDQGAHGMEFVPGRIAYTFDANWKAQMDNGNDAYHLTSTHKSFLDVQDRRRSGAGHQDARQFDWQKRISQTTGMFQFELGHTATWFDQPEPEKRPTYPMIEEIRRRVGGARAEWMLKMRNITIFPNMQIADGTSLCLRTFRPLAVDKTEMRYYCLAPVGEPQEQRTWRLRQFEDFFNVSGLATPDDTAVYEDLQAGYRAPLEWLQGYARGMEAIEPGASNDARVLGFRPVASLKGPYLMQNEASLHPLYREWARLMDAGIAGRNAYVD